MEEHVANSAQITDSMSSDPWSRLSSGVPLTKPQHEAVIADCLEMLAAGPPAAALVMQSAYLTLLLKFLREYRSMKRASWDATPGLNDEPLATFRRRMREGTAPWERLRIMAAKPVKAGRLRETTLRFIPAVYAIVMADRGGLSSRLRGLAAYLGAAFGSRKQAAPETTSRMGGVEASESCEVLREWLRSAVANLPPSDLRASHHFLLLQWALIQQSAQAREPVSGGPGMEPGEWEAVINRVTFEYGADSEFRRRLSGHPMLANLIEALFQRPLYPYAMTGR